MIFSSASGLRAYPGSTAIGLAFLCLTVNLAGAPQAAPAQTQETAPAQVSSRSAPSPLEPDRGSGERRNCVAHVHEGPHQARAAEQPEHRDLGYKRRAVRTADPPGVRPLRSGAGTDSWSSRTTGHPTLTDRQRPRAPSYNEVGSARWNASYQQSVSYRRYHFSISQLQPRSRPTRQFALFSPQYNTRRHGAVHATAAAQFPDRSEPRDDQAGEPRPEAQRQHSSSRMWSTPSHVSSRSTGTWWAAIRDYEIRENLSGSPR